MQRGEAWLLQRIGHTAGNYGFFAQLALAARQESEHALCWWETGPACERRYRVNEQWYNLRPDALAEYRIGQQRMRFWLEWDRGTMNVSDLTIKFTSYAYYLSSREWTREHMMLPFLMCIAPDIAQERRLQRVAQTTRMPGHGLVMWTTTEVLLQDHGPNASIWLLDMLHRNQETQPGGSRRQAWSDRIAGNNGT